MKKISKKLIAMIMCLVLLIGVMPITVLAATTVDSGKCGDDLKWSLNSDGVLTISGKGGMDNFDEEYPEWFDYVDSITSIVIQEGVTEISDFAFYLHYNVTEVKLPESLKYIGANAFNCCMSLKKISIPASVETIGFCAFLECYSLADFSVNSKNPNYSVDSKKVLYNKDKSVLLCASAMLEGDYTIPNTVTAIESFAFTNSLYVESISIPASVTAIGSNAFMGAVSLEEVKVDEANEIYSSDAEGVLFDKEKNVVFYAPTGMSGEYIIPDGVVAIYPYAFSLIENLVEVVIPDSVIEIGPYAFTSSGLKYMTIPGSVTYIGDAAFAGCTEFIDVRFEGDAPEIGVDVPVFDESKAVVYYPKGNSTWTSSVRKSFGGNITWTAKDADIIARGSFETDFTWVLTQDGTFTVSGKGVLYDYYDQIYPWYRYKEQIKVVNIKEGVTNIGPKAFANCTNLTSVTFPASVSDIEDEAFANCTSLVDVKFSEGLTGLNGRTFTGCTSLTDIMLPASLVHITGGAFDNCTNLTGIWVDKDNPNFSNDEYGVLFNKNKTGLIAAPDGISGEYVIPDGVTYTGNNAFENCTSLTSVILPDSLTALGTNTFCRCVELTSIVIPANVTYMDWAMFYDCSSLKEVRFEGNAPRGFENVTFGNVTATVYYPEGNETWTNVAGENYGGDITWVAYTPEDTHLLGDVNGDGKVSNADLVRLARYLVDMYDEESEEAIFAIAFGDVNQNGSVTNADLVRLARILVEN